MPLRHSLRISASCRVLQLPKIYVCLTSRDSFLNKDYRCRKKSEKRNINRYLIEELIITNDRFNIGYISSITNYVINVEIRSTITVKLKLKVVMIETVLTKNGKVKLLLYSRTSSKFLELRNNIRITFKELD